MIVDPVLGQKRMSQSPAHLEYPAFRDTLVSYGKEAIWVFVIAVLPT
jgi:hypothetical protein